MTFGSASTPLRAPAAGRSRARAATLLVIGAACCAAAVFSAGGHFDQSLEQTSIHAAQTAPQMLETWQNEIAAFGELAGAMVADDNNEPLQLPDIEKTDQVKRC